jgi:hypothetical protein
MSAGFAIRFRPADPRDASPALYLSTDNTMALGPRGCVARPTSVAADVRGFRTRGEAQSYAGGWGALLSRLDRDRLVADVVPLADALTDLAT